MGITDYISKKMARAPVVVETTRAIARQYLKIKKELPEKKDNEIYKEIVHWVPDLKNHRQALINVLPEIENLTILIYWILVFETKLGLITGNFNQKVIETIREVLKEYNLE